MSCHPGHSVKTLLMNAALGAGSELIIDVAQGVDWTGALAVVYGIQQVNPAAARMAMPYGTTSNVTVDSFIAVLKAVRQFGVGQGC